MQKAREELGEDARLVSARRVSAPGLPPVYEVRVTASAASVRSTQAVAAADALVGELRHEIRELRETVSELASVRAFAAPVAAPVAAPAPAAPAPVAPVAVAEMPSDVPVEAPVAPVAPIVAEYEADEPEETDEAVTAALPAPASRESALALSPWRDLLRRRGVGVHAADAIVKAAGRHLEHRLYDDPRRAVRAALSERFGPVPRRDRLGDGSTLFVGPTGSGKTTTVAKIAAELVAAGQRPVLVCADGESLTGEENLQAVATALGLPFESAFLDGQLESVLERLGEDRTYLVDTPGVSAGDPGAMESLRRLADALSDPEILVVIPATSDLAEARLAARAFAGIGGERIVLTKLDELARPGRIVDLAASLPRPVARVTYGRSARGACAHPGSDAVVGRILGSDLTVAMTA